MLQQKCFESVFFGFTWEKISRIKINWLVPNRATIYMPRAAMYCKEGQDTRRLQPKLGLLMDYFSIEVKSEGCERLLSPQEDTVQLQHRTAETRGGKYVL